MWLKMPRLFYQHGCRATGVDPIAAELGIGKMMLYRHYPSKDDLIVAFLRESNAEFWEYFEQSTKDAPGGREKLLAFFEALQNYVVSPACYGCPFINVVTEYPRQPGLAQAQKPCFSGVYSQAYPQMPS